MSLDTLTVDIQRDTATVTSYGGESYTSVTIYSGLAVTINYPNLNAVSRHETPSGNILGAGPRTKSDRVVFLDPWDGSVFIRVNDRVVPNPTRNELPSAFKVVAVRPYYDDGGAGELQLDVEDVD